MKFFGFFLALVMLTIGGCRSAAPESETQNLHITMDVNISEAAPAVAAPAPEPAKKSTGKSSRKEARKKSAPPHSKSPVMDRLVPPATGAFDNELNDVERSYIQNIRKRREDSVRATEEQIFGSFSPGNLFKSKK